MKLCLKIALFALGLALLGAPTSFAATFEEPVSGQALPSTLFDSGYRGDWEQDSELKDIVDLLEGEKRDEGRLKLAIFMKKHPENASALDLAALVLIEEGEYAAAQQVLVKAISLQPRRVSAIVKLGVVLLLQGKRDKAEVAFNKAVEYDPDDPLVLRYLAFLEQTRGNVYAAIGYLERLMQTDWVYKDRITDVHLTLAEAFSLVQQPEAIKRLLEPLILGRGVRDPDSRGALALWNALVALDDVETMKKLLSILRAQLSADRLRLELVEATYQRMNGNYDGARTRLEKLLDKVGEDQAGTVRYQLALVRRDAGDLVGAADELEAAAKRADNDSIATVANEMAAAMIAADKADRAIDLLDQLSLEHPNVPAIRYIKAQTQLQTKDLAGARRTLIGVVETQPQFTAAQYLLGIVEWQLGNVDAGRAAMRQAVTNDARDIRSWLTLAGMYDAHQVAEASGKTADDHDHGAANPMVAILDEALKANPGQPELLYEKAALAYSGGDSAAAEALYRRIVNQVPTHVPALNNLALAILQTDDDPTKAQPYLTRARRLAPGNPSVLDTYGWYLLRTGQTEDAIKVLEAVADAAPDDAIVQFHLGAAYLQAGRVADAAPLIEAALAHGLPAIEAEQAVAMQGEIARRKREG